MATTTSGQLAIRWIANGLNKYFNKILKTEDVDYVIASHTDSVYLSLDSLVNEVVIKKRPNASTESIIKFMDTICESQIKPYIDQVYQSLASYTNALEQKMVMKREILSDRAIWTSKTKYLLSIYNSEGVAYTTPKIKVVGLEMIRSSTPSACRDKLREAIDVILNKTEDDMIEFIKSFKKEFSMLDVEDISFPRGVNGIEKYSNAKTTYSSGTPMHVRASIIYNKLIKDNGLEKKFRMINEGDKIKFVYLKEPNPLRSNAIAFPSILPKDLDIHQYIDYNTQFSKSFVEPLKIILDVIKWKTERGSSLSRFYT